MKKFKTMQKLPKCDRDMKLISKCFQKNGADTPAQLGVATNSNL